MIQLCNLLPFHVKELVQTPDFEFVEAAWCSYGPYYDWLMSQDNMIEAPVVLDNSTHLLGYPMPDEYIIELGRRLRYRWSDVTIVLPDVKNDCDDTILRSREFLREHGRYLERQNFRVMIVGQGKTQNEFVKCVSNMVKEARDQGFRWDYLTLGVPYRTTFTDPRETSWAMNRAALVHDVVRTSQWGRVHLLGLSDPIELTQYKGVSVPLFNDSSAAYMYAKEGVKISIRGWRSMGKDKKPNGQFDIFEEMDQPDRLRDLLHNVTMLRVLSGTRMEGDS